MRDFDPYVLIWFIVVFVLVTLLPFYGAMKGTKPSGVIIFAAIFVSVFCLGAVLLAGYQIIQRRRTGRPKILLSSNPGIIGGQFTGVVQTKATQVIHNEIKATLQCYKEVNLYGGEDGGSNRIGSILWGKRVFIQPEAVQVIDGQANIPVQFNIPNECRPTNERDRDNRVFWQLKVLAEIPGPNFAPNFEVPVFLAEEHLPLTEATPSAQAAPAGSDWVQEEQARHVLAAANAQTEPMADGGQRIIFPRTRHRSATLLSTIAFLLVGTLLFAGGLFIGGAFGIIWLAGVGLIMSVLFLCLFMAWCYELEILLSQSGIDVEESSLLYSRTRQIPLEEIETFKSTLCLQLAPYSTSSVKVVTMEGSPSRLPSPSKSLDRT